MNAAHNLTVVDYSSVRVRSDPVRGVVTWGLPQCLFVTVCTLHSCKPVSLTLPFVLSHSPHSSSLFLSTFLSEVLSPDVAEMLLVVRRDVEEYGTWLNSDDLRK